MFKPTQIILIATISLAFISSCQKNYHVFNGYVDSEFIYLSVAGNGHIKNIAVEIGQKVSKDQLLFQQDSKTETLQLEVLTAKLKQLEAKLSDLTKGKRTEELAIIKANLSAAEAKQNNINQQLQRAESLYDQNAISLEQLQAKQTELKVTNEAVTVLKNQLALAYKGARQDQIAIVKAERDSLLAEIKNIEYAMSLKNVHSEIEGVINDIYYLNGEYATINTPILSLHNDDNFRLVFFVPLKLLSNLSLQEKVEFAIEGVEQRFNADVYYISAQAEYTPPVIFSENARQKLVYQVYAKAETKAVKYLKTGMPIDIYYNDND